MVAFHKVPVRHQKFVLFFIHTSIAQKASERYRPHSASLKKHAQYKNNAALQRKIVIQALETDVLN